jgi:hypothetical protein
MIYPASWVNPRKMMVKSIFSIIFPIDCGHQLTAFYQFSGIGALIGALPMFSAM